VNTSTPVQVLWNYCNVLRDDGMSYGDYVEQLTYLLFLKMADERSWPPLSGQMSQPSPIPAAYPWPALLAKDGDALFDDYRHTLEELGKQPGTLALIFGKAQNKFQEAKRRRVLVDRRAAARRPRALQRVEPDVASTTS
jgi:type I restriction enzyme M protein